MSPAAAGPAEHERAVPDAADVESSLSRGRQVLSWWREEMGEGERAHRIELVRPGNTDDEGYVFFADAPVDGKPSPMMGLVQDLFYDRNKGPGKAGLREELREFVLRYFLRIADSPVPEAVGSGCNDDLAMWERPLSWCGAEGPTRVGFTYSQLWKKPRGAEPVAFSRADQPRIVDLRRLSDELEWVMAGVRIHDFNLQYRPFGEGGFAFQVPVVADTTVLLVPELLTDRRGHGAGVAGEYGLGYFLLDQSDKSDGIIAYGPGRFGAGFQEIRFRLLGSGECRVRLVFVVNRPNKVTQLPSDPLALGWRLSDLATFGLASRLFGDLRPEPQRQREHFFDPVMAWIRLANQLTDGEAGQRLCISREQLERTMLLQHFRKHYLMVAASLRTWRRVPDWLDPAAVPEWVRSGRGG